MCEWQSDSDGAPSCIKEEFRKARKQYACYECGGVIKPGDAYRHLSGIWDGYPDSFRFCLPCAETMKAFTKEHGGAPLLGALDEALQECISEETSFDDDDNEILSASAKRWKAELDAMSARGQAAKAVANG